MRHATMGSIMCIIKCRERREGVGKEALWLNGRAENCVSFDGKGKKNDSRNTNLTEEKLAIFETCGV